METIILGLYNEGDRNILSENLLNSLDLTIEWNYEKYNIESMEGIQLMQNTYNLSSTGIFLEKDLQRYCSKMEIFC